VGIDTASWIPNDVQDYDGLRGRCYGFTVITRRGIGEKEETKGYRKQMAVIQ
jgi:hypothetical protein